MNNVKPIADRLLDAARTLKESLSKIDYSVVAPWVYDPFDYAWEPYCEYIQRYARSPVQCVFMGMNPGPWGMAQTGVPFGEVAAVRDWLKISSSAKKPRLEHPKRPIDGLSCKRSEVSGKRMWELFRDRFGTPKKFFANHFVINYCPLAFMDTGARNLTPDKFPATIRQPLEEACDRHLIAVLGALQPTQFIGVGAFAESCGKRCIPQLNWKSPPKLMRILHPSPASPAANRDWSGQVVKSLIEAGVWTEKT
ncbi:MAG: single-stranded DNA-binding protein [Pirellulaceae bacterium]|nr:single-stranded DNA-binding protein [Pirellulaceae bacterium]